MATPKPKMTRSENLNPPEDPGIDEELEPAPQGDVATALVTATDSNPKELKDQIDSTELKIKLLGQFIERQLKKGVDYGQIAFHASNCPFRGNPEFSGKLAPGCKSPFCKMSKAFLHKPGSEKFVILFNHRAKFFPIQQDFDKGRFAFRCVFIDKKKGEVVGEGYGAAMVSEKAKWTSNEAMKMAAKRAQIDCALRTYGLSEYFTQDLDDIQTRKPQKIEQNRPNPTSFAPGRQNTQYPPQTPPRAIFDPNSPITQPQMNKIFLLVDRLGKSKEWFEKWIFDQTGVEGIENLTKGMASKFIEIMQKKYEGISQEGMDVIQIDESKEESMKKETDTSMVEDVEITDDADDFDTL